MHLRALSAIAVTSVALLAATTAAAQDLTLTSTAFGHDTHIPIRHSAYGDNVSPALSWTGAPAGTRSFAIILFDTDVPMPGGFVHWVIYNIPGTATGLPEGLPGEAHLHEPASIAGTVQGLSGLNRTAYFGPRPPAGSGVHHYNFRLLALDLEPSLAQGLNRQTLEEAVEGHILAETTLIGLYEVK